MAATIEHIDFHGLPALRLRTKAGAAAVVSLHGAQVLSWTPPGGADRLYLSPQAVFDGRTAIRGGIPLCFPQFADLGSLPQHGFARTATWSVVTERTGDDFALLTLGLADDEATRAVWPHPFRAELGILIGIINLNSINSTQFPQIGNQVFSFIRSFSRPIGFNVFVYGQIRLKAT